MPQRSKSSAKPDSLQSETLSHRRTKRLRIDSDEEEDEGYRPPQESPTSYHETFTRSGGRVSSSPAPGVTKKRQNLSVSSPTDRDRSEDEDLTRDYDDEQDDGDDENSSVRGSTTAFQDEAYDEYGRGRLGKKKFRGEDASPSWSSSPAAQPVQSHAASASIGGRVRRSSIKAKHMTTTTTTTSKKSMGKGKQKASTKRKRKEEVESSEEEEYHDDEDEEVDVEGEDDEDEARFSEEYDDYEPRGKRGGRGKAQEREKETDLAPVLKKAKFEGNSTTANLTASTKRTRGRKQAGEDNAADNLDESGTPEPSSLGSPTNTVSTDGPKADTPAANSAPPAKKIKLPTIKKLKSTASSGAVAGAVGSGIGAGPSTPSSGPAQGGKSAAMPPPPSSTLTGGAANKLGIAPSASSTRPKTNVTTDLDLSNPSLYAELFKNPGGNASKTGLNRRAKEEERKKELDRMRNDYKVKFAEVKATFDLQGQAEKMARFEEVLRQRRSSALYPNFLAAKWREESEREKRRLHRLQYQHQTQANGHADNTKEEGEM